MAAERLTARLTTANVTVDGERAWRGHTSDAAAADGQA